VRNARLTLFDAVNFSDFAPHCCLRQGPIRPRRHEDTAGVPRRSTFRTLSAAVTVAILLATAVVGLSIWRDRAKAIADGSREARNIATVLGGQIAHSLQAIDIVLGDVKRDVELQLNRTDLDGREVLETRSFHQTLYNRMVALPQALHIIVLDHRGDIIATNSGWPAPKLYLGDRTYFTEVAAANDDELHIGDPVVNRITGDTAIAVSRRLRGADGSFHGIVFISFRSDYIESLFRSVEARSGQNFALARRDGTLLVSVPGRIARPGDKVTNLPPFIAAVEAGGGVYRLVSGFDHLPRWSAVHPLPDYPLVVFSGIPEYVLLSDWSAAALLTVVQTLVLLTVAFGLLWTIARQFRRLSASQTSLETTSLKLDTALNNMSQGLAMFDAEARLIICNEHYRRMFALPPHLAEPGRPLCEILADIHARRGVPDIADSIDDILAMVASGETRMHDFLSPDGRILAVRNVPMPGGGWVATFEDVTEGRASETRIRLLAHNDVLTGIANRSRFLDHLVEAQERLRSSGQPFGVLVLDLDHFKRVNDSLGHAAGDALLKQLASRLAASVDDGDVLARLGGDEFAVIQASPHLYGSLAGASADMHRNAAALAKRIIEAIGRPCDIDGRTLVTGCSIGIAIAPYDGDGADDLMKRADLALYKAKSDGRNGYAFFDQELAAIADGRHRMEEDLRAGLERGEFELHYQPLVDAATQRPRAMEALVRWRHPRDGMIAPDRFIPLAEDTGLIVALGDWILRTGCAEAVRWPADIILAINISPVQFRKSNLLEVVAAALAASGLPPQRLEIEITERVLLDADADNLEVLHRLKALGVSIALDDFGTGYSSLSYLTRFPFDKIKIDRSFTRDLLERDECAAVTAAVVHIGRSLDIVTVAEGVETPAQFEALRAAGVGQIQGYLFGRPTPARDIVFAPARDETADRDHEPLVIGVA
jgi:diguanylate cyclase (GGDEF)-like protein